jgi:amino acid permease
MPFASALAGPNSIVARREFIICTVVTVIIIPLMLVRNIQKLWPLATFSIVAIVYTSGLIVLRSLMELQDEGFPDIITGEPVAIGAQISLFRSSTDVVNALPIFCFAYNVHTTYPIIFAELNAPKRLSRMDKATGISMFACMAIYIMCGLSGYFYGIAMEEIQIIPGDCLKMYPSSFDVTIARFCIAVSVIASYTTLHFSARVIVEDLLKSMGLISQDGFVPRQFLYEIIVFVVCTVGVALVVQELDTVLGIVGSIAAIPFMFVFPGMLQTRIDTCKCFSLTSKYNGIALIVLGCSLAVAGFASTIKSLF